MTPAVRLLGRLFGTLLPGPASRVAGWLFSRPRRADVRLDEAPVLAAAERFTQNIEGRSIQGYAWGEGPIVFGVHGWASRGSRFFSFVPVVTASGYRLVTWDAPAHGDSDGRTTNVPTIARTLHTFLDRLGGVHALVAHSLGCWATAFAMQEGMVAERLAFVSPPGDLHFFSRAFTSSLGFGEEVHRRMAERFEERTGIPWSRFTAKGLAEEQRTPLLIVHDHGDRTVPVEQARALAEAWPEAVFMDTDGLGHRQIMRDPTVISRVVDFLCGPAGMAPV